MEDQPSTKFSRVIGTETEFGIAAKDAALSDPVAGSIAVIGHYPGLPAPNAIWDYENENPLLDARGFEVEGERERPNPEYNRQLNKVLANGGRLYVDGAHPEYSIPECSNPREVVAFERIGERILARSLTELTRARGREQCIVYKNNSDGKGNSYGYHENYMVSRAVPFDRILRVLAPFFVTRLIVAGAGKVGAENQTSPAEYQISQRADFFECLADLNTMVKRPIVNTRDEPHAEYSKYRRLHVIVGDANMAEPFLARGFSYEGVDGSAAMVDEARSRLGDGVLLAVGRLDEYEPTAPVDMTICLRAFYYPEDRRAFFARVAGYTRVKFVFDFDPRVYDRRELEADLRAAGFTAISLRPFFLPQRVAPPAAVRAALLALEHTGPVARLALRVRGIWFCAASAAART